MTVRSQPRIVVKFGGAVAAGAAETILELALTNEVCVVHGAGPQISLEMERLGLPVEFVHGRRVTTAEGIEVVRSSLAAVNQEVCAALGPRAIGFVGDEIGLEATPVPELGLVGNPIRCRPDAIESALAAGLIPVVAPLAEGPLNVNADAAAAVIAVGLGAERLLFVTDVPGLLLEGEVVPTIGVIEADRLLEDGELEGGIVPKLRAAVTAARLGLRTEIGETSVIG